ncbi:MAG TPA: hypothetical protein VED59_08215 [Acidimicrobiales bacterium]|nr:hypothetical protein [Acidimicrobiales bacterium]
MYARRVLHTAGAVMGAVMLGVGTLLQLKAKQDDHWSASPKVVLVEEAHAEDSGEPPGPG